MIEFTEEERRKRKIENFIREMKQKLDVLKNKKVKGLCAESESYFRRRIASMLRSMQDVFDELDDEEMYFEVRKFVEGDMKFIEGDMK